MEDLSGNAYTWDEFAKLDPQEICERTGVVFDQDLQLFTIKSFGQDIFISTQRHDVFSDTPEGSFLLGLDGYFFGLSILWYLNSSKNIALSGELVKPSAVPGGQIFVKGTHVLPLDKIALKFNNRQESFLGLGRRYGAVETDHGDVALKLFPFPKLPVYLILWFGDEDFPPSGQLLLDSTCSDHLSTDVLWAITMVCCQIFLHES